MLLRARLWVVFVGAAVAGARASVITCSKLSLGEPHTAPYHAGDHPLCLQLKQAQGVELQILVEPPSADVCFNIELTSASTVISTTSHCLGPADRGRLTLRLPAYFTPRDGQLHYAVISTTGTAPAHAAAPVITTTVSPLGEGAGVPPPTFFPAASVEPPCPPPSVSAECISQQGNAIVLCRPDSAELQRLYPNCRATDCRADVMGCLLAHRAELSPACSRAVGGVSGCCPKPPKTRRCPTTERQAVSLCANDSAALQARWPRQCWAANCTAGIVGCLLSHQAELRSRTCGAAVADVAECCPRAAVTRCAEQEDSAALLCQADAAALQRLLPHECWATNCEADMLTCLLTHQDLLRDAKCAAAVRSVSACAKGAWDLLGPMVIAAYLLLATASVVLLCTMLRCCCRCLCTPTGLASLQEDLTISEDEAGTEDDDLGSVTPLPVGVKQPKTRTQEEEEEENALPGYSEVVEGASIALQPTSAASSS